MARLTDTKNTPLSEEEATFALRAGWKNLMGEEPSIDTLAILWAQSAHETGRWKFIYNYNFGNIKKTPDHDYCMYRCSEIINSKEEFYDPPHFQTHFNAYNSAVDGATEYIKLLKDRKRYQEAWKELEKGDPIKYCTAVKKAGYFTAGLEKYMKSLVSLVNEFKRKSEKLLSYKPKEVAIEEGPATVPQTPEAIRNSQIPPAPKEEINPMQYKNAPIKPKGIFDKVKSLFKI